MREVESDLLREYKDQRKEDQKDIEKDLTHDIQTVLSIPEGQNFIWWILELSGVFVSSYTGNSDTYLNEGKRLIGLEIVHRSVQASPDNFMKMIQAGEKEKE